MTDQDPAGEHRTPTTRLTPAVPTTRESYGALDGYVPGGAQEPGDLRSLLLDYVRIFYKRRWLILGVLTAFVALGAVRTLMTTPLYTATVRLQIDRNAAKVVEGDVQAAMLKSAEEAEAARAEYQARIAQQQEEDPTAL